MTVILMRAPVTGILIIWAIFTYTKAQQGDNGDFYYDGISVRKWIYLNKGGYAV